MRKTLLAILSIYIVSIYAAANENEPPFQEWVGKTVTVIHKAGLHSTAPKGLFCSGGDDIDDVEVGESVHIRSYRKVTCGLFFSFEFFEIVREDKIPFEKRFGFVRATDNEKPRFQLKGEQQ